MKIIAVIAIADNWAMGSNGELPWPEIKEDFKRFRDLTLGKPVVMGRHTYESIKKKLGRNLPGRTSIVVSNSLMSKKEKGDELDCIPVWAREGGVGLAVSIARAEGHDELVVIGGAQTFSLFSSYIDELYLTIVHLSPEADVFFPAFDLWNFEQTSDEEKIKAEKPGLPLFSFVDLKRIKH